MMLLNWYIGLILRPIETIREIVAERPVGLGLVTLLIVFIANGIVSFGFGVDPDTFETFTDEEIEIGPAVAIIGAILFVVFVSFATGVSALIVHLISKLFGGDGAFTGLLSGLLLLSILSLIPVVPGLLDVVVRGEDDSSVFASIAGVVSLAVGIWTLILAILLIRENYQLSTLLAVLSGIASFLVSIFVGIIVLIMLIAIWVTLIIALGIAV